LEVSKLNQNVFNTRNEVKFFLTIYFLNEVYQSLISITWFKYIKFLLM